MELARFHEMVRELQEHPKVAVLNSWVGDPIEEESLDRIQAHLGYALDSSITDVYRQANGLTLLWMRHDDPAGVPFSGNQLTIPIVEAWPQCEGCICLLPLEEVMVELDWRDELYFDHMTDEDRVELGERSHGSLSFHRSLRPFDYFSSFRMAAFTLIEEATDPKVLIGDDHGACWIDSRTTDLASYMETLLAARGLVEARKRVFMDDEASPARPPLVLDPAYWETNGVSLDQLLEGGFPRVGT